MKKLTLFLISFFSFFCGFSFSTTLDVNNLPKLERYVTDFTDTLTMDELNELEAIAENYHEKTTNQLVAVVIPDRQGRELFDIGMKIFNENEIGTTVNNGLLLLIANNERKIRIIVGYGLEDEIPDLKASQMIEKNIRPLVDKGQLFEAIKAYYAESQKAIDNSVIDTIRHRIEQGGESSEFIITLALILGFITGKITSVWRPLLLFGTVRKKAAKSSLWRTVLVGIGILWILGGSVAITAYLFGIAVGLGIIKLGKWGGSGGSQWGGRMGGGFSWWGGRSGGGGAGD